MAAAAHARSNPIRKAGGDQPPASGGGSVTQQRLQGAFLTIIGLAGAFGGVLFSIEAPKYTPVPVVFLSFWLVMVIVGQVLFAGLRKLRAAGVGAPAPEQVRAAAAVAGIVVAVGMMGFAATTAGGGSAVAAPCPGGGPETCGPTPGQPELTFTPPAGQQTAPGGQQGQQGAQQGSDGIATSPAGSGGENGPGIQAQTPDFGTPGQPTPNIPGNEPDQPAQQPGQGQGQQQGSQQQQSPVQTTAAGRPQQGQQTGGPTQSGEASPSRPTVTVTQTQSQCPAPAAPGAGGQGAPGGGGDASGLGAGGPDGGDSEDGAPSWAYLVGEVTALMTGRRGRKAGPLNSDGSAPTNKMIPGDQVDGENYKEWTTPDGDRTFILSENENAPEQYRFKLDQPEGGSSRINDDGSASVFDRDGNEVSRFDKPWAYDTKTGEKIPTRYSVDGDDLVQTIDRPEGNNNPILADPDETNVGIVNTTGRQDGESWTETRPNGETLTHTIVPGSGGQSVDTRATRPDGSFSDIRTVNDGQGGWQSWSDDSTGGSSYAGQEGAGGDHFTERYDGSPLDGQAPRVTSTGNADNSQGTITGTNYDGTQSTGDYNRVDDGEYQLTTQNPNNTVSSVRSVTDEATGEITTAIADNDGVKTTDGSGNVTDVDVSDPNAIDPFNRGNAIAGAISSLDKALNGTQPSNTLIPGVGKTHLPPWAARISPATRLPTLGMGQADLLQRPSKHSIQAVENTLARRGAALGKFGRRLPIVGGAFTGIGAANDIAHGKDALQTAGGAGASFVGGWAGAAAGASIGAAGGPIGMAIGGLIGGAIGSGVGQAAGEGLVKGIKSLFG
ncbi:hypothetical protein TPB0596_10230 [Tsukamurella pulmonis]|uniref:hypothetical protein n=1 Tax=Tsukamurella pulmonis TaxID=47312 RepID=UPI001EDE5122|nr:hypothetical protein [Tsukamurella pulmonis]BDD81260.1 hypothetical protein TPB0596_10230 [Tsukamurella pulmonis]